MVLRLVDLEYSRFVYYWLRMRKPILISLSNGGGQPNLSQDDLKKLWIPIPDICEQRAIAQYLDKKLSQVEDRIEKVRLVIDKLNEFRSALITNAVTGKIDVRNHMASVNATHSEAIR